VAGSDLLAGRRHTGGRHPGDRAEARTGVARDANPGGATTPPPVEPLWYPFDWVFWGQIAGALLLVVTIITSVLVWRRHPDIR
jgi:hypothetical protein